MTIQILEQIIEQYGKDIYSFCLRLTGQKEAAEELYQDVWLMALKQIDVLEEDKNIRSFLLSVAISRWHNQKRKYAWRKRIVPNIEYVDEMVNQQAEEKEEGLSRFLNKERNEVVKAAVAKLKDRYRIPIMLFYMEEMTIKEIADLLQIPQGTVKSRLNYAKKLLKKELEEYIDG